MDQPAIITLTTDFGTRDSYVAEVKAVLLARVPGVQIVDVTHELPPQNVLAGSVVLERVLRAFPPRTVHVAVVDPGVGTSRRALIAEVAGQFVVGPDNGLITWAHRRVGPIEARAITAAPARLSRTFHGRDLFAPVAAELALGKAPAELGRRIDDPVLLDCMPAAAPLCEGRVLYIDHFGNAVTNVPEELLAGSAAVVEVAGRSLGPVRQAYADVAFGEPLALAGSGGLIELAVRNGSAAQVLGLSPGSIVRFTS